jgi:nucleotide-binding universal stress UspA family protein
VRKAAVEAAQNAEARLILYDIDAAGLYGEPLPSEWSGEGAEEEFGTLLTPQDLQAAGRHELAEKVQAAREDGLETYGWLPSSKGAKALQEYAAEAHADLIIVPSSLEHPSFFDRLRGENSLEKTREEVDAPIVVVDDDGRKPDD